MAIDKTDKNIQIKINFVKQIIKLTSKMYTKMNDLDILKTFQDYSRCNWNNRARRVIIYI